MADVRVYFTLRKSRDMDYILVMNAVGNDDADFRRMFSFSEDIAGPFAEQYEAMHALAEALRRTFPKDKQY